MYAPGEQIQQQMLLPWFQADSAADNVVFFQLLVAVGECLVVTDNNGVISQKIISENR